jgi:excisionase family DNA binding protein
MTKTKPGINLEELPPLMTVEELSDFLRIGRRKTYEVVRSKGFPMIRLGNAYRIPKKAFLTWLEKQTEVV